MSNNSRLLSAKQAKKDEFYTQLKDIEQELQHYTEFFDNKVVLCNCDDPYESNFFRYFVLNFNRLHLKSLISTCYNGISTEFIQLSMFDDEVQPDRKAIKVVINQVPNEQSIDFNNLSNREIIDRLLECTDNTLDALKGNGDFRSAECIEILNKSDVVVTNPPFSLFREIVDKITRYKKDCILLGHQNAAGYSRVFDLIKRNKLRCGYGCNMSLEFYSPYDNLNTTNQPNSDKKDIIVPGINWYTSFPIAKHNEFFNLTKHYNEQEYCKYDNSDIINVDRLGDIPCDYYGEMGVPLTFIARYNPEQFEILDNLNRITINGVSPFRRVLVKRKK